MTEVASPAMRAAMDTASTRRIDHLVLQSRDLEAQAEFYKRLGFQVGARNVHPWGTENRLVQFDGCFLELITLGGKITPPLHAPRQFSFGHHVGEAIRRSGDGMSMLVLSSPDGVADAAWFKQAGIADYEPFRFGRKGKRPDGTEIEVAFTLAFTSPASMPDLSFFTCQQHFPENFWNPTFQRHDNTATGVRSVVVVADDPLASVSFLKAFAGGQPQVRAGRVTVQTAGGIIEIATPTDLAADLGQDPVLFSGSSPHFGAVVFTVQSLDRAEFSLRQNNVPHRREQSRVLVPSGAGFGVVLAFEEART
jgi:catechol 2,3-dioxygenase-like lactoylglutathione lyase family enzyme